MTLKYKKRKKYRKHTRRERGQKEKKKNKIKKPGDLINVCNTNLQYHCLEFKFFNY